MTETYAQESSASSPVGEAVRRLIAGGCDPVTAAIVAADLFAAGLAASRNSTGIPPDSTIEKRRAWDRERKRKAKENSTGIPPEKGEFHRNSKKALVLSSSDLDSDSGRKEERKSPAKRKSICPLEFAPTENNLVYGDKLGLSVAEIVEMAREMQEWSQSSGNKKLDWSLTLNVWMRRKSNERKKTHEKPANSASAAAGRLAEAAERGEFNFAPKPTLPGLLPAGGGNNPRLLPGGRGG